MTDETETKNESRLPATLRRLENPDFNFFSPEEIHWAINLKPKIPIPIDPAPTER
jgi:hypothetical protein